MILCAAIQATYQNGEGKNVKVVIPGFRHADVWELMTELGLPPRSQRQEVEGFIDNHNAFLDREEAYLHARACGQIPAAILAEKDARGENKLYSEDLY